MTLQIGLFKLLEDTNAFFIQQVDYSTDDEVPRSNFTKYGLSFRMKRGGSQDTINTVVPKSRKMGVTPKNCEPTLKIDSVPEIQTEQLDLSIPKQRTSGNVDEFSVVVEISSDESEEELQLLQSLDNSPLYVRRMKSVKKSQSNVIQTPRKQTQDEPKFDLSHAKKFLFEGEEFEKKKKEAEEEEERRKEVDLNLLRLYMGGYLD
eukprot:GHVP01008902.1.p1 GENE.GHVP01008902.1~~GHVP01008902.1.p1  ORF type:complete len:205 (-),score=31.23 GHVP01008902.1:1565-2179(-)